MQSWSVQFISSRIAQGKRSRRTRHSLTEQEVCTSLSQINEDEVTETEIETERETDALLLMGADSLMRLANGSNGDCPQIVISPSTSETAKKPTTKANTNTKGVHQGRRKRQRIRTKKLHEDIAFDHGIGQTVEACKGEMKYSCKTCNRKFLSFQALGGHRASCYNKSKTYYAELGIDEGDDYEEDQIRIHGLNPKEEEEQDNISGDEDRHYQFFTKLESKKTFFVQRSTDGEAVKRVKVHECPVCYKVFASGQALGGHKRCHSSSPSTVETTYTSSLSTFVQQIRPPKTALLLDLNMPAPMDDEDDNYIGIDDNLVTLSNGKSNCGTAAFVRGREINRKIRSFSSDKEDEADSKTKGFDDEDLDGSLIPR